MNLYETLGVSKDATTDEIKKVYAEKELAYNLNKTADSPEELRAATEEFKRIFQAYQILNDPSKRANYDQELNVYSSIRDTKIHSHKANILEIFHQTVHSGHLDPEGTTTVLIKKSGLMNLVEIFGKEVNELCTIAAKSPKYEKVARKLSDLYNELYSNISVFSDKEATSEEVLLALENCCTAINAAEKDGEFANHRGFARNTPVLLHLLKGVDILRNFFDFLDKKIGKIVCGDKTPVFNNRNHFCVGMFKSANTTTVSKIEELKKDLQWYVQNIKTDEDAAHTFNTESRKNRSGPSQ